MKIKDLSNLGQNKEGKLLELTLPSMDEPGRSVTVKEFGESSLHNFDEIGKHLQAIYTWIKGQNNVNEVLTQRVDMLTNVMDKWIEQAKLLDEDNKQK